MELSKFNNQKELHQFLDEKADYFERSWFIEDDPISVPKRFTRKEDIEIAAFFSATLAWGHRKTIIRNASTLMSLMDNAPFDFITNHQEHDLKMFQGFVHRTFQFDDLSCFCRALQRIYLVGDGLESVMLNGHSMKENLHQFKATFFEVAHLDRTRKHISDPNKGSSAKRLNMFLRWMVRPSKNGVDFGLWKNIQPSELLIPLDVHTGNVGRKLGLLKRKQQDWKSAMELTNSLRKLDPQDPIKYDFALFGIGAYGINAA